MTLAHDPTTIDQWQTRGLPLRDEALRHHLRFDVRNPSDRIPKLVYFPYLYPTRVHPFLAHLRSCAAHRSEEPLRRISRRIAHVSL